MKEVKTTSNFEKSIYDVLRTKEIISILDGDANFGDYEFDDGEIVPIAMPYLSGPAICNICTLFGLSKSYSADTVQSRWQYFDELIAHCGSRETGEKLLSYLFDRQRFIEKIKHRDRSEFEKAYKTITESIIERINVYLSFSNMEMVALDEGINIKEIGTPIITDSFDTKLKKGKFVLTAFNKYELVKQIGQGGNGKVWEAKDKDSNGVAIKFLERSKAGDVLKRFKNEAFFCLKNSHKNILPILDYGTAGDNYIFYVMPLYKQTLRDRIKAGINHNEISIIFSGILEGLRFAHEKGTIHRDIKPENILFDEKNKEPIIADFGIAHFAEEDLATIILTGKSDRMANFQYAAPEQRKKGGVSVGETDIYAVALILNEMFTGEVPQALDYRKIGDVNPEYSYLDSLFEQMFKQNPEERLYPEDKILSEMKTLAIQQKKEEELARLNSITISLIQPEEYNPQVNGITYEDGKLMFELNRSVNNEWLQTLRAGIYPHSFLMGFDTNRLQQNGDKTIAIPVSVNENKNTVKTIVGLVKDWIDAANEEHENIIFRRLKEEQQAQERERLEAIRRIEQENDMSSFLSSLV